MFWHHPAKQPIVSSPAQEGQLHVQQANKQENNKPVVTATSGNNLANPILADKTAAVSNETVGARELNMKQAAEERNVPVRFYGMVIDQNSNALSGVRVKLGVRHNVYAIPNSLEAAKYAALTTEELQKVLNPTIEVETDSNGRFQWVDSSVAGDILGVASLVKDGYEPEPGQYSCKADSGNFADPVIFKMWSTNVHEKLITGEKKFQIVPDGRPYMIDLTQGTIAETGEGDLKVWVKRPEQITSGKKYDWACEVDVINGGGLLQVTDASTSMYEAPADGYTPSFSYEEGAAATGWGDTTGAQQFYIRLNNGQKYGRIAIELEAYYNDQTPGLIRLSYTINPSGSRILR